MSASTSSRGVFIWPQLTPDEALIMIRTTNTARMRVLVHHLAGALTGTKTHENRRTLPLRPDHLRSGGRSHGAHHLPLHRLPNAHRLGVPHKYPCAGRAFRAPQWYAE